MTRFLRYAGITLRRPCALLAALSVIMISGNTRCLHRLYSRAAALAASGNGGRRGGQSEVVSPRNRAPRAVLMYSDNSPSSTAFSHSPQCLQPAEHVVGTNCTAGQLQLLC